MKDIEIDYQFLLQRLQLGEVVDVNKKAFDMLVLCIVAGDEWDRIHYSEMERTFKIWYQKEEE